MKMLITKQTERKQKKVVKGVTVCMNWVFGFRIGNPKSCLRFISQESFDNTNE